MSANARVCGKNIKTRVGALWVVGARETDKGFFRSLKDKRRLCVMQIYMLGKGQFIQKALRLLSRAIQVRRKNKLQAIMSLYLYRDLWSVIA